jgi:hypothetical protein
MVWNVIGTCAGVAFGLALYLGHNSILGMFIVAWSLVATPIGWWLGVRSRRRLDDPTRREDHRTGQRLNRPAAIQMTATLDSATQWVGAADVPGLFWRVGATVPLAVLEIVDSSLILRVRLEALARWTCGVEPLVVSPSEVEAIFPARGRLRASAIGIRPVHGPPYYFLTAPAGPRWYVGTRSADRPSILSAIEAAGFPVDWDERSFSRS